MFREHVLQRLAYLRNLEFLNIFLLPLALAMVLSSQDVQEWQPYAYGMAVICLILAEGTLYWHVKLVALRRVPHRLPGWFRPVFRGCWWLNVVLLVAYVGYVVWVDRSGPAAGRVTVWSHLLWLFALLEHINYFHYQLSHDNRADLAYLWRFKKLRRSPLRVDLDRQASAFSA